jgi:uncharacterized protein YeaO (DUF488 family)
MMKERSRRMRRSSKVLPIFTVGHSTRPIADFIELLQTHGIKQLIDIRTIPKSHHNPQFNSDALAAALRGEGIRYVHLKALGGLRHAHKDSVNLGWRNASFRGFADYMQTPEFAAGLDRAIELAQERPSALMCAEAVPWRCHRSLVADALLVRGARVLHITSKAAPKPHSLTPFARVDGLQITYPGERTLFTPAEASKGGPAPMANGKSSKKANGAIRIQRVYDRSESSKSRDGARFLVERLWPRGVKKDALHLDAWLKDVAPSPELRKWYEHRVERWPEFQKRYLAELRANPDGWKPILEAARRGPVTLLYAARDTEHNSALLLQRFLSAKMKSEPRNTSYLAGLGGSTPEIGRIPRRRLKPRGTRDHAGGYFGLHTISAVISSSRRTAEKSSVRGGAARLAGWRLLHNERQRYKAKNDHGKNGHHILECHR